MRHLSGFSQCAWYAAICIVAGVLPLQASAQWKPQKNIEIISPSGPGSGIDTGARSLQKILQDERLLNVSSTVVNKDGGGQAIGFNYLNQHAGDGHFVCVTTATLLTNHINKLSTFNYTDFTSLAQLYTQSISFSVNPDSPIKTAKQLIERLKKDPASVTFGTSTARGNHSHAAIGIVAKAAGADVKKLKVVIFKSGGESLTAALGGHIDVLVISAGVVLPQLTAGKLNILAVTAPKRRPGVLASVPTWKENGIDITLGDIKALIGPRGMTPAQVAYWDDALGKLVKTESWKRELEKQEWEDNYMNSRDSLHHWKEEYDVLQSVLVDLGLGGAAQ
jgi:putative tricarboxylic transport membrane protein